MSTSADAVTARVPEQRLHAADVPLLVISFDGYRDLWKPFFGLLWKWWPDCPFRIVLGTNRGRYDDPRVTTIEVGDVDNWAERLRLVLDRLESKYVVLFLEDFFFHGSPDTAEVVRLVELGLANDVGCLRLKASPPPFRRLPGQANLGPLDPADPYRVSTQVSLWRVDTLRQILVPGHSIWDVEILGSRRSDGLSDPFWGVFSHVLPYEHGVERGKWFPAAIRNCRMAGIDVDLTARPAADSNAVGQYAWRRGWGLVLRRLPRSVQRANWRRIIAKWQILGKDKK